MVGENCTRGSKGRSIFAGLFLGGAHARHVWPSHKMQRTFLNWRKSVDLVSARALNNQARYKYHQSKLIPSHQVRNTQIYHMTRTDPRAISLENHMKKVPYEGRTPRSSRAGKSRTALLEKRTAPLLLQDDGIGTS